MWAVVLIFPIGLLILLTRWSTKRKSKSLIKKKSK